MLSVFLKPMGPRALRGQQSILFHRHQQDFRRLGERSLQPADVAVDQRVVQDVAVDLGEGGVAIGESSEQNHELQQVGVRLLPERFLRLAEQVVQQRGDGKRDRIRIEVVVQGVVADAGVESNFDVVIVSPGLRQDATHLPTEVALHLHHQAAHLPVRDHRSAIAATGLRTDTCRPMSCRYPLRPGS